MAIETKYRTCNLCEALCGLEIRVENNKAISIKGDDKDVLSHGHICPKAVALIDIHEDPDRLRYPLKKNGAAWEQISWEEAYEYVAEKLVSIQATHGDNAVGIYQGNPSVHNLGTTLFSPDFVRSLKTTNRFSATSVDQLAHHLAAVYMFGHPLMVPVPDINRTMLWVIIGGNPLVSNGSMMTAPGVHHKIKDIQKRGGKVIVIDPRRTETANKSDQHIFIKPGSDFWLLAAICNHLFTSDSINIDHLKEIIDTEQVQKIRGALQTFTLEIASERTGISLEVIHDLINDFITAESAVCYGRLGVSAAHNGSLSHWLINSINILTNNFDKPGGAMFTNPAVDVTAKKSATKKFGRWKSRVKELPEFNGELPSAAIADDILEPGEGQIRAMITSCGNPVLSVPNGKKLDQAFSSLEFMVSIDIYLNETTQHADIILPPATGLETAHYGIAFHNLAIHNTAKYSEAALDKAEGTKYDWEIFSELKQAYLNQKAKSKGEAVSAQHVFTLENKLDFLLQSSPHKLSLEELKKHKHGIDLKAHIPKLATSLKTDNQKINLFPEIYKTALADLAKIEDTERDHSFMMIGRRHLRSNNSWMHNLDRLMRGRERCTVLIHPSDASALNINEGQMIRVTSDITSVEIAAEITDDIMQGAVSIPHGWGHHRSGTKMEVAESHAGVSYNDLADDSMVDSISGVSVINAIPVQLSVLN